MDKPRHVTRRMVTRNMGAAAGLALVAPGIVRAALETPAQTEGPFYPITGVPDRDLDMTVIEGRTEQAAGEVILVRGRIVDSAGQPLNDASVDIWQANHYGRYTHPEDPNPAQVDPNFHGWGVTLTDARGVYGFKTIKPAAYRIVQRDDSPVRCRHIHFQVKRPGFADLTTQMYFEGDPLIEKDLVMADTPAELRHLLIAGETLDEATGLPVFWFDVVMGSAG